MYTKNQKILLLIDSLEISKTIVHKFIKKYNGCDFVDVIYRQDGNLKNIFKDDDLTNIKNAISCGKYEKIVEKLNKSHIFCLFYGCKGYPEEYLNLKDAPIVLYTIGDVNLLTCPKISIIGTRKPTKYGKDVVSIFVKKFADCGLVTVSDLAFGIDGLVASETLDVQGKTIAILAGGLDNIYPTNHTELARNIVKSGGLLLTEHPLGVKTYNSYFVERNRLLAGLCDGLLVVEASQASATMNTVDHALNFGKELFVVPGNITSELSKGTNKLISEIPHSFTISPVEVIEKLGILINSENDPESNNVDLTDDEKSLIDALYEGEMSFDDLQEKTKINVSTLSSLLTSLEISGLIKKLPGNYYSKN